MLFFLGLLQQGLQRQTRDEVIAWLLWRNQTRLHSTLAYVSPVRSEQDWLRPSKSIRDSVMGTDSRGKVNGDESAYGW